MGVYYFKIDLWREMKVKKAVSGGGPGRIVASGLALAGTSVSECAETDQTSHDYSEDESATARALR